jgi:hypothetical protein
MSSPAPAAPPASVKGGRRGGPWLAHVKKTMRSEAGKKKSMGKKWFSYVLKSAKKTYHKKKRGGGDGEDSSSDKEAPVVTAGTRRRRRRRS